MNKNYEETRKMIDALVKSAQNGSQGAKETLSITFRPLVISMIQKHVWEKSNWDDAYGEGMVVLLETIDTYNPETKVYFSIYLKKRLFYRFMEMGRKQEENLSLDKPMGDDVCLGELVRDTSPPAVENCIAKENNTQLHRLIQSLPQGQRQVIIGKYFRGMKPKALSLELGISTKTIETHHARAMAKLRLSFV